MEGICPHPSVLVRLLWPVQTRPGGHRCLATSVQAGLILCLVLETSLSLTPLQTPLYPDSGHGCPGSSKEGTRWMPSDSGAGGPSQWAWQSLALCLGSHSEHALSRREGERERNTRSVPVPPTEPGLIDSP